MKTGKKILIGIGMALAHTALESATAACYRTAMKSEKVQDLKQSKTYKLIGDILSTCKDIVDTAIGGYIIYKAVFK